jgi:hypothetical protein
MHGVCPAQGHPSGQRVFTAQALRQAVGKVYNGRAFHTETPVPDMGR